MLGKHSPLPRMYLFPVLGTDSSDLVMILTILTTGRIQVHGIGGGHKQRYRMIDFLRFRPEQESKPGPFEEKVMFVRYDPCRQVWDVKWLCGWMTALWLFRRCEAT